MNTKTLAISTFCFVLTFGLQAILDDDISDIKALIEDIIYKENNETHLYCSDCRNKVQLFVHAQKTNLDETLLFCNEEASACVVCRAFGTNINEATVECILPYKNTSVSYTLHQTCYEKITKEIALKIKKLTTQKSPRCYNCQMKSGMWICLGSLCCLSIASCLGFGLILSSI